MVAAYFAMREFPWAIFAALGIGVVVALLTAGLSYFSWRRFTYLVGDTDIRVESGILSRAARSVPYERIQDVSLEQALIPRILGLVQVRFETGAGGKDELALSYLAEAEGERLREVVKARKDGVVASAADDEVDAVVESPAEILFAMNGKRLLTFGLFEFSLAVFAVLAGLFQYVETFASIELTDPDFWAGWIAGPGSWLANLGPVAQILGVISGLVTLVIVGSITGIVRTFLRDWGFRLERTEKGFRRRRGLLTKTDVVMPVHRVQALKMGTGFLRRRFGWHGLKVVSLAQDSGAASHDVAPFAQVGELRPIAKAAGFSLDPSEGTDWHRGSRKFRTDSAIIEFAVFLVIAIGLATGLTISNAASPAFALIALAAGGLFALRQMFLWRFDFNALGAQYFFVKRGWLAPKLDVASRVKLQSVEIIQGPIAKRRGYATLKLGLAGGTLEVEGLPLERARALRSAILGSIAGTDFSELTP
ncbi:PH domain-containing protein [Altererythrobacter aquaemixtae]|uniref:PH domain-containing protein n=2 Tax=Pontixanthobacter aquaemixtae TaxID=1958940 RepID=A0A844ZU83_9SPHN|nr:PH domain-containing protein [Pontixanthobacter aquaemixtae]